MSGENDYAGLNGDIVSFNADTRLRMSMRPLNYQMSNFDCAPTTMLNAISYLFERERIPAEVIRNIMLYSLDTYASSGKSGENGTSRTAMMFLCNWLNGYGMTGYLPITGQYCSGEGVSLESDGNIAHCLNCNGAVVMRVMLDVWHYVLATGIEGESLLIFDPFYDETGEFLRDGIEVVTSCPDKYNRIVPLVFFRSREGIYSMGDKCEREVVMLYNRETQLTPEKTIEYFI